jgi:hypothetical protein
MRAPVQTDLELKRRSRTVVRARALDALGRRRPESRTALALA